LTDLRAHLQRRLAAAAGVEPADPALVLQPAKDRKFGDVALACFVLAKQRGAPPPQVAQAIAGAFAADEVVESAAAVGPYVNLRYRRSALARSLVTAGLLGEPPFGQSPPTGKSIVIDYSSPNIAKPFHVGHLRSTVIGAALYRIHRHLGHTVHGINHLGDWGAQFGKIITAFQRWGSEDALRENPMRHMYEIYVRYGQEAKADPRLDAESAEHFRALESGEDNTERRLWQRLRDLSLQAFAGPYRRLGVTFDHYTGESFYEDRMEAAIARAKAAGAVTLSDGAEVVELAGMPPCILRKSDGTTIYATRDLAAIFYRWETFGFDRALYVVGAEQRLHFEQLKGVLRRMGLADLEARIEHVPFGLMLSKNKEGKWEKFATRHGTAIFLEELLDEAVANVERIMREKNPDLPNLSAIAEQVGVSAIVFNDLKNARTKDVRFDWDAMLNFDGETGPYVQYAVARLTSILSKAGDVPASPDGVDFEQLADAEQVLLSMLEFGPVLARAEAESEPSHLTALMLQVAGDVHAYLKQHHVLSAAPSVRRARLAMVLAARNLLRTGLGLLGVSAPDEM
jgi:arginyl-tRNA synthetase